MRYYMKLSDDWDVNMCKDNGDISGAGGKFPGLADVRTWADPGGQCGNGGASGDGINCWSMRLNYRNCDSNDGEACATKPRAAMRLGSYLYYPLQGGSTGSVGHWDEDDWNQSRNGTCDTRAGNLFCGKGDGGVLERGQWYQIEMQVEMNTPGKADGVIRGWIDGQLSYEKTNMVFRNEGHDFLHNRLAWFNIYKGGMDGNCSTSHVYLDQMVIALDQPVGGIDSVTEIPPSLRLEVSPEQPTDEEAVTVEWTSENAHSCRASGLWEGGRALGNRIVIGPFSESGVLQLDCEGHGGKATRRVELLVNGEPITQQRVTDARLSAPRALAIAEQGTEYLRLQWEEAPEKEDIVAYRVQVNGEFKDEVTQPRLTVHNLLPGMRLEYRVQAVNSKGYLSRPSEPLVVSIPDDGRNRNSATLYPDSDTYLARSTFKTLGRSRQLAVSANRSLLLKFPVELLERQRVRSATLVLTPIKQFGQMTVDLYRVAEDWHERSATREYSDQDNRRRWQRELGDWLDKQGNLHGSNAYESVWLRDTGASQKVEIDLTELVNAWLAGDTNNGVMLRRKSGNEHFFHSKEAARPSHWPRLEVRF
ncbi:DNRLRE domain-containing protein [Kineobactrum salinum]|uniref:DNRLRE domain-containing protein n=1 Tax=Kineobactrum salinum TaxID=2708301 RepID=A0A6C0TYU0_9GAMM|nr:DNRLRE domain-containing protein [Kineobactrum salinum]QIB64703.1 DNRLRE domain-containing protein [Kineobactrum salinum]